MSDPVLDTAARLAVQYLSGLGERPVGATATIDELRARLGGGLPEEGIPAQIVLEDLAASADAGLVASAGGRFFGFVLGGSIPAALGADWLASAWDQNAGLYVSAPAAAVCEEVAGEWLRQLFGLPEGVSVAFVTGGQMANFTCLAAARHALYRRAGWDVEVDGIAGAPPLRIIASRQRHVTIDRALRFLGLGTSHIEVVDADDQGRMRVESLRECLDARPGDTPVLVCAQVGNVNSGAFDAIDRIADVLEGGSAWLHVDGAFGLWAAACPSLRRLTTGLERADSWAVDAHKWLNVPYDSGLAFVADPASHRAAMSVHADYLQQAEQGAARDGVDWHPEFSRRARGFAVYAALRALGRSGLVDMIERTCALARHAAERIRASGEAEVLNEVVLNQVLVRFGPPDERTNETIRAAQSDGTCWVGGTLWQGRPSMRISVSNWRTTQDDIEASVDAILRASR